MADLKKEILKKLDRFQYSRGRREVFLEAVEHMALTIATKFDPLKQEERSDRIAEILSNYKGQDSALFFNVADGYAFTTQRHTPKTRRLFGRIIYEN